MLALRRALLALLALGVIFAGLDVAIILISRHEAHKLATVLLGVAVGLSYIGVGVAAWWRRPLNRFGPLMTAVGFAWFLNGLQEANSAGLFTIGLYLGPLFIVLATHMVLTFPSGRLETTGQRVVVAAFYLAVLFVALPYYVLGGDVGKGLDGPNPGNAFALFDGADVAEVFGYVATFVAIVCLGAAAVLVLRKLRDATPAQRRQQAPMVVTGLVLLLLLLLSVVLDTAGAKAASDALDYAAVGAFAILPYAFLAGLVRSRYSRAGAVGELIEALNDPDRRVELRDALAEALGDPTLGLLFWRESAGQYVTADGRPVELPGPGSGRAVTEVRARRGSGEGDGALVGAIVHEEALVEEPELVRMVAGSAGLALDNERLQAELRARVEELQRSRARLLDISTFERRRLERDLHDGAQQRLVALSLQLSLAERKLESDPDVAGRLLTAAREELSTALGELRELARGIHPAILTDRGLGPALQALAERAPLPVDLSAMPQERLPPSVEAAAYFVVSESLTNVAKYAHAQHAVVSIAQDDGYAVVEVRDDGVGGADPGDGTGPAGPRGPPRGARRPPRGPLAARPRDPRPGQGAMRVVLADDSLLLREGVARLLEDAGLEVVAQAGDAEDLLRKVGAHKPDLAIVDVRMPPTHTDEGLKAAVDIRERFPSTGVLVLSQYIEESYALELLSENAEGVGYLLKDRVADLDRFVDAVRRVGDGGSALDPEVVSRLLGRRRREDPLADISPREKEVLALMAEGRSNHAIATELVVTERAVEKHVTSIFSKLDLPPTADDHRRVLAVLTYLRA